jgi:hypothetical protein
MSLCLSLAVQELLGRDDITKTGVNISNDAAKLRADFSVEVAGVQELSQIAVGREMPSRGSYGRCSLASEWWAYGEGDRGGNARSAA